VLATGRVPQRERAPPVDALDRDAGQHLHPALLERADDDVAGLLVNAGQDRGQRLEDCHLAPDVRQIRRELATDRAPTDDRGARRYLVELEEVVGREDLLPVELQSGQLAGQRAGGEDQCVAHELGAVVDAHVVRGRVDDGPAARHDRDLAPLEQRLETLGELVDHLLLASHARGQVERGLARVDTELLRGADGPQHLGGLEQLLGRDAPAVQAGSADAGLLDHRDPQPRGRAEERGGVTAGTTTEHDHVEALSHRAHHLRDGNGRRSLCAHHGPPG
jgi:hypothetical protein